MPVSKNNILKKIYRVLLNEFGPQSWWPAKNSFEVIVGAILTQNTSWVNVERAIENLRKSKKLSVTAFKTIPLTQLSELIKPAGYFNVKAKRLKNFIAFLCCEYQGSLKKMQEAPLDKLRMQLLKVNGIGPETADSILLYAFNKPAFVVDAYTHRMLYRHNFVSYKSDYHAIQDMFFHALPYDWKIFNEYHALIVCLGKFYCKPEPLC